MTIVRLQYGSPGGYPTPQHLLCRTASSILRTVTKHITRVNTARHRGHQAEHSMAQGAPSRTQHGAGGTRNCTLDAGLNREASSESQQSAGGAEQGRGPKGRRARQRGFKLSSARRRGRQARHSVELRKQHTNGKDAGLNRRASSESQQSAGGAEQGRGPKGPASET